MVRDLHVVGCDEHKKMDLLDVVKRIALVS